MSGFPPATLLERTLTLVPGVGRDLVGAQLLDVVREFLADTAAWQVELPRLDIVEGQALYAPVSPIADTTVSDLVRVLVDGAPWPRLTREESLRTAGFGPSGGAGPETELLGWGRRGWEWTGGRELRLRPTPQQSVDDGLYMIGVLVPENLGVGVPGLEQWGWPLVAGTVSRLFLAMPHLPSAQPASTAVLARTYATEKLRVKLARAAGLYAPAGHNALGGRPWPGLGGHP